MKATQSFSKSSEENNEDKKLIACTAKVEHYAMSTISRGSYYSNDVLSCCSYFSPKDETGQLSDIDGKGDDIFDELISVKKCNIKLLKILNESEQKLLQLPESEAKLQDAREKNESFLAHIKEVELNMKNALELNAKL